MLNCHDATFLMSQGRERTLSFPERMKLRLHVAMCSGCANFGRQLKHLGAAAKALAVARPKDEM
jgi:heterodisulfide reductase subunit B